MYITYKSLSGHDPDGTFESRKHNKFKGKKGDNYVVF